MNRIIISDEEKNTILEFDDKDLKGNTFYNDGRIENITYDDIEILKDFILSPNNTKLPNEGEYSVVLDNNTGLKHYFLDNREDYTMLFKNNGEYAIDTKEEKEEYIGRHAKRKDLTNKEKRFKIRKRIIHCTLVGLLYATMAFSYSSFVLFSRYPELEKGNNFFASIDLFFGTRDITADDLINSIYSSPNISDEDQQFLAKRDLFEDILPYVNTSNFSKQIYGVRFNNDLEIKTYDNTGMKSSGYFSYSDTSSLYIAEKYLATHYDDIISHEFIHMLQVYCNYNVISEACAEIVSSEYYDNSPATAYSEEVYLIKKLMEIIGPDPVAQYTYTNDFSGIKNEIKPYLTENEYQIFLADIRRPNIDSPDYDEQEVKEKHESLNYLLDQIYERKFNKPSEKDIAIPHLKDPSLVRYYFNQRKKAKEGSHFLIPLGSKQTMTLEDAIAEKIVYMYQTDDFGNTISVSYFDYLYNTYDTNRPLEFGYLIDKPVEINLGEDGKLHVSITTYNNNVKAVIPNVEEKLAEEAKKAEDDNQRKL